MAAVPLTKWSFLYSDEVSAAVDRETEVAVEIVTEVVVMVVLGANKEVALEMTASRDVLEWAWEIGNMAAGSFSAPTMASRCSTHLTQFQFQINHTYINKVLRDFVFSWEGKGREGGRIADANQRVQCRVGTNCTTP